jgi:hypothetical protein
VIRSLCAKNTAPVDIHSQLCEVYGEKRSGWPSVSDETIAKVEETMLKDRRVTIQELCEMIPDVSKPCIDKMLTDHLRYAKVCARWVPRLLTETTSGNMLKRPVNFFRPTKPMARNSWTLHWGRDLGPLHDTGNETTIPSVETSRVAEAAEVQTNTVCRQSDGERLLGQEGVIIVRIHACRYNNQCKPLL